MVEIAFFTPRIRKLSPCVPRDHTVSKTPAPWTTCFAIRIRVAHGPRGKTGTKGEVLNDLVTKKQ